ncbi:type I polyketide synthase [Micromonospora humidisoli]|uniref:Type I polyketide synthase n=1 Tax=Micromonospora humidisoli TaxID=2807622 RepID=A0ABS2JIJ2_9ACTN|nr:type I polyketide synthase [Micromonospora humidisoli]MBM7086347.1 type I polyketide synthase [Micromonospora humidisoli]
MRRDDVALRLFAFPHAGGGPQSFAEWPAGLPADVEVVSFALPDRGQRRTPADQRHPAGVTDHRSYTDRARLVDDLVTLVDRLDDGAPFAFFGHSFGALVAFEVCRRLAERGLRVPRLLMLSAHRAPHLPPARPTVDLPDDDLVHLVRQWGLVPADLLADPDLLALMLPPLRADLALDEAAVAPAGALPEEISCVVYAGTDDPTVTAAELAGWSTDLGRTPDLRTFAGGHFFTLGERAPLLADITDRLDAVRAAVGPSVVLAGPPYPPPAESVWQRFEARVDATPDALALLETPRRWTYRELRDHATAVAGALAARGVGAGDVVGLLLPHTAEYPVALLACFGLGSPACLLEQNWPGTLLAQFLASAQVRMVVTTPQLAATVPTEYPTLVLDATPAPGPVPVLGRAAPDDIALISMTSGTSGTPKAVLNTHLGCLYCFDAREARYPYTAGSRDGLHVFLAWECLRPLLSGRPAVIIPDDHIVDPVRLLATLHEQRITRIVVTPSLFEGLLDHPLTGPAVARDLAHMEIVFLMGEVVPTRIVDKAVALMPPGVRLVNAYSTWESLDVSYADLVPARDGPVSPFAPVGRLLDGSAAVLLDDTGRPVPRGGVGELLVAGPGVATGYLDDPAKTAERFVAAPDVFAGTPFATSTFYRTGDRARLRPDGEWEVLGRTGDVVKVRGFKVSLRTVEHVLAEEDGVARVVVRPVPDRRTGQPAELVAYVQGATGEPTPTVLARLRRRAARELPEYARPRHLVGLAAMPVSGGDARKLDLTALPPPPAAPVPEETAADPLNSVERRIAAAWREVLGSTPGIDDSFFAVGGDSLSAARLSGVLASRFGIALPVVDIFQAPTLRMMAARCAGGTGVAERTRRARTTGSGETRIAVVGMAGRFPGADDIDTFWANLCAATDSLTVLTPQQLRHKGVAEEVLGHPGWVPAAQLVDGADTFDAAFWGIGQREAVLMDPQHRVFIETAWTALEQAGYARRDNPYRERTGVFAACGIDGYLIHHLRGGGLTEPLDPVGVFLTEIGNEKDYIATRVAYLLDLGGPAVTVTSACSSALVAVAQAAQSIATGQCDMAVAGASALTFPNFGYRYEEGLVGSVDGVVRPFDAAASGTLFGDAVGAVVLKRLDVALADGDPVWAVLTGYGVSNDGRMKAGYTAPSAQAQARCISDAIAMAGVTSDQISYVECHATATHVGDAIELAGLRAAFEEHRDGAEPVTGSCAIGSVKGNIGHANCAAGITGLIKTVLSLHHRTLVPTVHHDTLNPKLVDLVDTHGSPFTVRTTLGPWTVVDPERQLPRRAGVSSFGIGGTNAHVILEEFVGADAVGPTAERASGDDALRYAPQLATVSARDEESFPRQAAAVAAHLAEVSDGDLAAATRALHLTRESHPWRAAVVIDRPTAAAALGTAVPRHGGRPATVAFCFSGQGSQRAATARSLGRGRVDGGRFRRLFDEACAHLAGHLDVDPGELILGADERSVRRPLTTQCGLFAVGYALARTLVDVGVVPVAVAGHSIGEYAAAAVSGLLDLDEAAELVAVRATATERLAPGPQGAGGMLGVHGDEQRLAHWLSGRTDLWLAAENAPGRTVLSGPSTVLRAAAAELSDIGFSCRALPVSHAFHSGLMAPVADRLAEAAGRFAPRVPAVPVVSNVTGAWFDAGYRPGEYWAEHALAPVRWRGSVDTLLRWEPDILVEIGPGTVLTTLSAKCLAAHPDTAARTLATLADPADDETGLLSALGQLWCHGVDLDFAALHDGAPAVPPAVRRALPTYRFAPTSHWTRPEASVYVDPLPTPTGAGAGPLTRFADRPAGRVRLYCFPYAGGTPDMFRSWAHTAPDWLDVVAVDPTAADLAARIEADAGDAPVAFCGLSSGASHVVDLLTGDLAHWAADGRVDAVCVVGRAPLTAPQPGDELPVEGYLLAPDELRADPRWQAEVLPRLHEDLARDARHAARVAVRGRRLDCPVQVHHGSTDVSFPAGAADGWADITTSPIVETRGHEGGHDFMVRHRADVLAGLVAFLDRLVPSSSGGRLYDIRWLPVGAVRPATVPDLPRAELGRPETAALLTAALTGPEAVAVLHCPTTHDGGAALLSVLRHLAGVEARGRLVLVLPVDRYGGLAAAMSRCLPHEEAGLTVLRYHTDEATPELPAGLTEPDLRAHDGVLLAPRRIPIDQPDLPAGTLGATGGNVLLVGGTGGIGGAVTDWLLHHQRVTPDRVVVTGRTDPGTLRPGVRFARVDLTTGDGLADLGRLGGFAGVVHLAGALDDGLVRHLDPGRLPAVLAPKLAWDRLVEWARVAGTRWMVAFSSTSALFGAAGQANYAAANGWLDAAVTWATPAAGPAVASVAWGTWGEVGMAAGNARALAAARSAGETPLPTGAALRLFGQVVGGLLAGTTTGLHLAAYDLGEQAPQDRPPDRAGPVAAAAGGPPTADHIRDFLGAYVHRWDESQRLSDLGLDSLDFARLRGDFARRFGRDVPLADIARQGQRLGELYELLTGR